MMGEVDTVKVHYSCVRNCEKHIMTAKLSEPNSGTLQLLSPPNLSSFPRCLQSRPRYPIRGHGALRHLSPHLYCITWSLFLFFPQSTVSFFITRVKTERMASDSKSPIREIQTPTHSPFLRHLSGASATAHAQPHQPG